MPADGYHRLAKGFTMSGKLLLLLLILIAGIAGQQYKAITGQPAISLVEGNKNDCSQR